MSDQNNDITPQEISMLDIQNIEFIEEPYIYKPKTLLEFETPPDIYKKPKKKIPKIYDEIIYPTNITTEWSFYKKSKLNIFSKTTLILSAIGKKDVGKTKLLLHLLDYDNESSTNLNLKGLGIIYPKNLVTKNVTLLELSGMFSESSIYFPQTLEKQFYNDSKVNDIFINYIISVSNIILLVVNDYSFEDIEYIHKIKKKINPMNKLIIIHNLKDKETINECEKYIEKIEYIFVLQQLLYVLSNTNNLSQNFNKYYYREFFERETDNAQIPIVHVIYAKDNTEAGNYYNSTADIFLRSQIASHSSLKVFNVVNSINNYLYKESLTIFNVQKKIKANRNILELENIDENAIDPEIKKIKGLCYNSNDILTFKLEIISPKIKFHNISIKRSKEYYSFLFQADILTMLKYLENEQNQPNKNMKFQFQISIQDGDLLSNKSITTKRVNNCIIITYKFPPNAISDDEFW